MNTQIIPGSVVQNIAQATQGQCLDGLAFVGVSVDAFTNAFLLLVDRDTNKQVWWTGVPSGRSFPKVEVPQPSPLILGGTGPCSTTMPNKTLNLAVQLLVGGLFGFTVVSSVNLAPVVLASGTGGGSQTCLCIPNNVILGLMTEYGVCYTTNAGGKSGTIDIYNSVACQPLSKITSIPWTSNTNKQMPSASIIIHTTGGIGESVLAFFANTFGNAFVEGMRLAGYSGVSRVDSVSVQGNDIIIAASFSSPFPFLIAVAVILAILTVLALVVVQGLEVIAPVVSKLSVGLNALLIASSALIAIGGGAIVYSFVSSSEGRKELRRGTVFAARHAVSAGRKATGVARRASSKYLR